VGPKDLTHPSSDADTEELLLLAAAGWPMDATATPPLTATSSLFQRCDWFIPIWVRCGGDPHSSSHPQPLNQIDLLLIICNRSYPNTTD
jgi:hypothetical protein